MRRLRLTTYIEQSRRRRCSRWWRWWSSDWRQLSIPRQLQMTFYEEEEKNIEKCHEKIEMGKGRKISKCGQNIFLGCLHSTVEKSCLQKDCNSQEFHCFSKPSFYNICWIFQPKSLAFSFTWKVPLFFGFWNCSARLSTRRCRPSFPSRSTSSSRRC